MSVLHESIACACEGLRANLRLQSRQISTTGFHCGPYYADGSMGPEVCLVNNKLDDAIRTTPFISQRGSFKRVQDHVQPIQKKSLFDSCDTYIKEQGFTKLRLGVATCCIVTKCKLQNTQTAETTLSLIGPKSGPNR